MTDEDKATRKARDLELVDQTLAGDRGAFDELVKEYYSRIYALAYNMCSNREEVDDIVQLTFIKAYRSLKRFRKKSSFYTWLYRIGVNTSINQVKKMRRRQALSLDQLDLGIEKDPDYLELSRQSSPFRDTKLNELQEKLNAALLTLSEKHRTVVIMHDIEGMPHEEIARILKCSAGTVRSRLFYARQQLQAELKDYIS